MSDSSAGSAAEALINTIRRRIESRYRRICFVHRELAKLDAAAKRSGAPGASAKDKAEGNAAAGSFEDFVFSRIDFSIYKKIDAEEFRLLFDEGLSDYEELFFRKAFAMNRKQVRETIRASYIRVGPFYVCKGAGPLLLSIMRTLHTSLEFAPLLTGNDAADAEQLGLLRAALDGVVIRHDDGMETRLFIKDNSLYGTFRPMNKAYTLMLA
ncbi:MAG: hypothetical protein LBK77_01905 [Spirochaetaceae bacterium]|jgi:hypothetical protein|nr:hypothetical protein [Spirochaetaceae bacterium]